MLSKQQTLKADRELIWHPFTQAKDYAERDPIVIVRGEGVRLFDADGKAYYDTISSWWTNTVGHCHPRLVAAAARQSALLEHVNFSGFTHEPAAELALGLSEVLPPELKRFFFSDNGSTAVEAALKMAFQYWQNLGKTARTKFAMLGNAYHGDTLGAVSVGGVDLFHRIYRPLTFDALRLPGPDCSNCPFRRSAFTFDARETGCSFECFQGLETALRADANQLAAVIVEPLLQGAGGMLVYPPEILKRLAALSKELGFLLIFDEVATGFGRTGTLFAFEQAGVIPDILCLSKGLSGGFMPLALTVATVEIYDAFYGDASELKTFFHGHSYTAHPLACAVAVEHLQLLKDEALPESQRGVMDHFHARLRDFAATGLFRDVRYLGFVGALDLAAPDGSLLDPGLRTGLEVYYRSLQKGLVLRPLGDTSYWFLPLVVTKDEVDEILDRSLAVFREVLSPHG